MKILAPVSLLITLISCSGNHFHDGIYKGNVFNNNLTWVQEEQIELNGSKMHVRERSVIDSSIQAEYKTTCSQFEDRIEFKDKNGIVVVGRFDDDGNLKYGDYTYKRADNGENQKTETSAPEAGKPVIKKGADGRFTAVSTNTTKKPSKAELRKIKTYSDGEVSYYYVDTIGINENEPFFQGNKNFGGHIDDVYSVTISGDQIKITEPADEDKVLVEGTIKNGKILDSSGSESNFRFKNSLLYYHGQQDQWYVFNVVE
jgi:hypothetical protein